LVVSNVPGPQQPLYLLGRRIREIYPYVPLSPQNHAISLGLISYDGRVFFGLAGDRDIVADLDDFAAALRAAIREQPVPRAPAARPKPRPKAKPKASAKPKPKAKPNPNGKPRRLARPLRRRRRVSA
ncbi:MAG: WS/DGAT domain-containing protein, partial [Solirubrobacterales bacterium]